MASSSPFQAEPLRDSVIYLFRMARKRTSQPPWQDSAAVESRLNPVGTISASGPAGRCLRGRGRARGPPPTSGDAETFFTFPQCHDFRFPPSEKKKKGGGKSPGQAPTSSPAQPSPSPAQPGHGGARARGGRAARAALAAAAAGVPGLPQRAAAPRGVASFMMAPLLEFLLALFLFYAYASKLNEKFKGLYWPLTDFLRCVTAAIIYFAISIAAVSKYNDGASKAAGVFGFVATIVFAIDFYITFNDLVSFLKQGSSDPPEGHKSEDENSDSDSD
ncbi:CKLF-like MARVEL transmembrane domain-containing protein 3 isoform X1 [Manacus candei]|nr:CKLF-like MARVEL transmembrane domain-containing protein 3 isoform X1 [Manacus candei]